MFFLTDVFFFFEVIDANNRLPDFVPMFLFISSQLIFTCSNSTTKTLKEGAKYVQS